MDAYSYEQERLGTWSAVESPVGVRQHSARAVANPPDSIKQWDQEAFKADPWAATSTALRHRTGPTMPSGNGEDGPSLNDAIASWQ